MSEKKLRDFLLKETSSITAVPAGIGNRTQFRGLWLYTLLALGPLTLSPPSQVQKSHSILVKGLMTNCHGASRFSICCKEVKYEIIIV